MNAESASYTTRYTVTKPSNIRASSLYSVTSVPYVCIYIKKGIGGTRKTRDSRDPLYRKSIPYLHWVHCRPFFAFKINVLK